MRVRILRGPSAGRVVDLPEPEALRLIANFEAEEDKQLPGPSETKPVVEIKPRHRSPRKEART